MPFYSSFKPYNRFRALIVYILGMVEFRAGLTTHFADPSLMSAYYSGRERLHKLTFRRYDDNYNHLDAP